MMLKEVKATRQNQGEPFRRWYTDNDTDLIVWLKQYEIVGFQLTVPAGTERDVLTWHEGKSPRVEGLDDGEGRPGRPKMSPMLTQRHGVVPTEILHHFREVAAELPSGLSALIERQIGELHIKNSEDSEQKDAHYRVPRKSASPEV
jgi:hypothetical protein